MVGWVFGRGAMPMTTAQTGDDERGSKVWKRRYERRWAVGILEVLEKMGRDRSDMSVDYAFGRSR